MAAKIKISGLEEFKIAMNNKSKKLKAELPRCVEEAVNDGYDTAKKLVPIGPTHDLSDSIQKEVTGLEGTVSTDLRYAHFVEFGTAKHGDAQPFIRPAQTKANSVLIKEVLKVVKSK